MPIVATHDAPQPPSSRAKSTLAHLQRAQDHLARAAVELAERTRDERRGLNPTGRAGSLCELASLTTDCLNLVTAVHAVAEVLAVAIRGSEARP